MPASARGSHSEFRAHVIRAVQRIPVGRVATYGDIARLAGRPRAWRAVGTIMRTCRQAGVPCHRVVASAGRVGGYGGNEAMKAALLRAEGLLVSNGRVRQFRTARWQPAAPKRLSRLAAKAGPAAPKRLSRLAAKAGQRR